jgi:phospho-N-acetylmuramoyl-pentapeptide-transferase
MLRVFADQIQWLLEQIHLSWLATPLYQLDFRALAAAALSFTIVVLAGPRVIRWLRAKKIGDSGMSDAEALRHHTASKAQTPTMGGILIVGAILFSSALLADVTVRYVQVGLIVLVWLAVLGGFDDWLKLTGASRAAAGKATRQGLFAWEKLVFQIGLGLLAGYFVYGHGAVPEVKEPLAHVLSLPFQAAYLPEQSFQINPSLIYLGPAAFIVLTLLMITGMSNAANISDGMDGLAAGVTAIVAFGLAVLVYIAGTQSLAQRLLMPYVTDCEELLVLTFATSGACLGFLWWNCSPAKVFMGDTGSLALGGLLAYVAVVVRQEILLLLMSGVFLLEIASVVLQVGFFKYTRIRTGTGKRIFKTAPFHHHLHLSGWTEQQVVTRFWIISCILVVIALTMVKLR